MIKVRFDKNGFYHDVFGRMGRGKFAGRIYELPDMFAERETIEVDIRDPRTREVVGTKKIERYKHLPQSAEIIDEGRLAELADEAAEAGEDAPKPVRPKVADPDKLKSLRDSSGQRPKTTRRKKAE